VGPTSASHPSGAANHSPSHPPNGTANDLAVRSGITCARIHGVDMHCVDDVYRRCRDLGMRLSRQRRMVLDLLWAQKSHLSARDIYEQLNDMGRNIGHTSVYQNLEALQSAGVIECLDRANGRLYGYRADPHSHLTCVDTGEIQDLDVELPPDLLRRIEEHTGFAIESYTLHLAGRRGPSTPLEASARGR
jgi:Fur family ferric uptake transcriptional regulator